MGGGRPAQACLLEPWNRGSFCHAHHSSATCGAANTCSRLGRAGIKMRSALQTSCTAFYLHHVFLPTAFRQSVTYPVRATSHRLVSTHPHWAVEWMLFTSCIIGCSREGTKQRAEKGEEKGRVARHIEDHHTGSSSTPINQSYPNSLSNRYNIIPLLWEESHRHPPWLLHKVRMSHPSKQRTRGNPPTDQNLLPHIEKSLLCQLNMTTTAAPPR